MTRMLLVLAVVFSDPATALPGQEARPSERREVAGQWVLNDDLSDDLPLLPGEAIAVARASGAVRVQGRPSGGGADYRRSLRVRAALRQLLEGSERLTLADTGSRVVVTDMSGASLTVPLDGRKLELDDRGVRVEVTARWESPLLVLQRRYEDGTIVEDELVTFTEPRQLVSTTTIHNGRTGEPPVVMRRVYDPAGK